MHACGRDEGELTLTNPGPHRTCVPTVPTVASLSHRSHAPALPYMVTCLSAQCWGRGTCLRLKTPTPPTCSPPTGPSPLRHRRPNRLPTSTRRLPTPARPRRRRRVAAVASCQVPIGLTSPSQTRSDNIIGLGAVRYDLGRRACVCNTTHHTLIYLRLISQVTHLGEDSRTSSQRARDSFLVCA